MNNIELNEELIELFVRMEKNQREIIKNQKKLNKEVSEIKSIISQSDSTKKDYRNDQSLNHMPYQSSYY